MKNVKVSWCLIALFILNLTPTAWSDETPPDAAAPSDAAAPPATTDVSNEGVPPAPVADPGMGAGSPEEAPVEEAPVKKKKKKAKHAKKKASKHSKKKKKSDGKKKKKKKKKKHNNY